MVDGKWVRISKGSMMVMPASLYHAGDIRTSVTGNRRGHFYFYCRRRGAALVDIFDSSKGAKQDRLNTVRGTLDPQQQYLREDDMASNLVFRTAAGLEFDQPNNTEWLTEGVKTVGRWLAM